MTLVVRHYTVFRMTSGENCFTTTIIALNEQWIYLVLLRVQFNLANALVQYELKKLKLNRQWNKSAVCGRLIVSAKNIIAK